MSAPRSLHLCARQQGGGRAPVLEQFLQHDDPALLERVARGRVVAGDPAGDGQEPRRAAPEPGLGVLVEQRTPDGLLEPIAQGLGRLYGSVEADVARGLALRMDHGSQYLSDHFLNQLRYWGIHPSFGFVEEPETNGVVERWNRTLKEQAVYGRVFRNLAEVRAAVAEFVVRYNQCWRLEKLAYRTPLEAREEYKLRQAA